MDASFADPSVSKIIDNHYTLVRVDIDKHPGCVSQYGIDTIPRLIAFDAEGNVHANAVGGLQPTQLKAFLEKASLPITVPKGIHPDLEAALKAANTAGKKLLVDFHGNWNDLWAQMDDLRAEPAIKEILDKNFYYFQMEVGHFDRHNGCLDRYKVHKIPTLIAFNSTGSAASRFEGPPEAAPFKTFLQSLIVKKGLATYKLEELPAGADPIATAIAKAGKENRRLIVYFYQKNTQEHTAVETSIGNAGSNGIMASFALLRVEASSHSALAKRYGCTTAPFVAIFDRKGKISSSFDKPMTPENLISALVNCEH